MKIHHVGIMTQNLDLSSELYCKLGYIRISEIIIDRIQHNRLIFFQNPDSQEILELIEPINQDSTVNKNLNGYHHICYEIENLDEFEPEFKMYKIGKIFTNRINAPAFNNKKIIFAYLKNGTLIEFFETGGKNEVF